MDHRTSEETIKKRQGTYVTETGNIRKKRTTAGWEILVQWKDNTHDWIKLKDLKESYPVELMEYATRKKIDEEPAFAWWVPHVCRKSKQILQKVKSKYLECTHKYGI